MKEVICCFLSLFTPNQKTRPGSTLSKEESFMRAEIYKLSAKRKRAARYSTLELEIMRYSLLSADLLRD